jgi:multidrug resistance efflux pump
MINLLDQTVSPPALIGAKSGRLGARPSPPVLPAAACCRDCRGAAAGHRLWRYETYLRFTHIYEYDARATADIVTISSRAEGWVVEMPALEGTRVEAGQVVARIDDRVAKLKVDGFKARSRASGPSARG